MIALLTGTVLLVLAAAALVAKARRENPHHGMRDIHREELDAPASRRPADWDEGIMRQLHSGYDPHG